MKLVLWSTSYKLGAKSSTLVTNMHIHLIPRKPTESFDAKPLKENQELITIGQVTHGIG